MGREIYKADRCSFCSDPDSGLDCHGKERTELKGEAIDCLVFLPSPMVTTFGAWAKEYDPGYKQTQECLRSLYEIR